MIPPFAESTMLLLASRSPRRKLLVQELRIPFRVVDAGHTDEDYPGSLSGGGIARYLAEHKSEAYMESLKAGEILLTADTIVWNQGRELGKPETRQEALDMIMSLSGNTHQVYTGVCLRDKTRQHSFFACTDVRFARLESDEAAYYVDQYRPYDKAGAYGIQEWIGHIGVEHIAGSYFNVMGLPVQKVYSELKEFLK